MISVLQKQYVTWFTNPYHDLTSEMLLGVGKSLMAAVYLAADLIPLHLPSGKSELVGVEHQALLVAVGEHAADPEEGSLYCVGLGDDIVHYLLKVLVGRGGGAVLQDCVRIPAVAVPR